MTAHKPPCPGPEAHTTRWGGPSCTAHLHPGKDAEPERLALTGMPCKLPPMKGQEVCGKHGGRTKQNRAAAAQRLAEQAAAKELAKLTNPGINSRTPGVRVRTASDRAATRELVRLGVTRRDIHPAEALLELVSYQASIVDFWRNKVSEIDDDDLVWGTTRIKTGGDDHGETQEAKPHIAYTLLGEASDRLASYAAAALKAGVDERRVRLAESQGQLVAQAMRQVLDQLNLTADQLALVPTVVPAALRLISGSVA